MPIAKYQREWRKKNLAKVAGYMRTWRAKHREKHLAYQRKWTDENRSKVNQWALEWYQRNKKSVRKRRKEAYIRNPEKFRLYERGRKRNKILMVAYRRKHYLKYRNKILQQTKKYAKEHPEVRCTTMSRRRARLRSGGQHTSVEWLNKIRQFKWRCGYCNKRLTRKTVTKDHVIPLCKGGTDDLCNVIPSCLSCNQTKHVKLGWVFSPPR